MKMDVNGMKRPLLLHTRIKNKGCLKYAYENGWSLDKLKRIYKNFDINSWI